MISWIATRVLTDGAPVGQIADLVEVQLGALRIEESIDRQQLKERDCDGHGRSPTVNSRQPAERPKVEDPYNCHPASKQSA